MKKFFYVVGRFCKDIWIEIRDFPLNLATSLSWFGFMWHDRDWDYVYFYKVMRKKLIAMEKHLKAGPHSGRHSDSRMIRLALTYLDYMIGNKEPNANLDALFTEKYGTIQCDYTQDPTRPDLYLMNFSFTKCTPEQREWVDSVWCRIQDIKDRNLVEYKRKFFYILEKYTNYWWT